MTPEHRFAVVLVAIGLLTTMIGYIGRRFIAQSDKRWEQVQTFVSTETSFASQRPMWLERIEKAEQNVAATTKSVADLAVIVSRLEALQDARIQRERIKE